MKLVRKILAIAGKPVVILHLLFLVQLGLFAWTTFRPYTLNVPDRTYNYLRGHLIYSSLIRQAKDGAWSLYIPHSTRATPKTYAHLFFVLLGKIAAIGNIDPPIMYMISRVVAALVLFWCTYWFIRLIVPPPLHVLTIIFTLALEPGPLLTQLGWNPMAWRASIFSYYPQIVTYRHFGLPHHTMGEALGLLFLGVFILCVQKPTLRRFILLALLAIVGTTTLPPYFVILGLTVYAPWSLYALVTRKLKPLIVPLVISALAIGMVGLFMSHQFAKGYPWKDFNQDEKRWVANIEVIVNYVSTLLLYIPFVAFLWAGLVKLWRIWDKKTRLTVFLMSCWVLLPVMLVPISPFRWFPLANFRLMDGYNYVPMGILAALGFSHIAQVINKKKLTAFLQGFLLTAVIVSSVGLSVLYTKQTFDDQQLLWTNVYVHNDHWKAFKFLNTVPRGSGIMVTNHFGEIIPEFAPVRSFIGSTPGYVDWDERFYIAMSFFSGTLSDSQAKEILTRENIAYVYYQNGEWYGNKKDTLYPNLLTPVFDTPEVTIYKVNPSTR